MVALSVSQIELILQHVVVRRDSTKTIKNSHAPSAHQHANCVTKMAVKNAMPIASDLSIFSVYALQHREELVE
jgi:hypothetical protein